jgi:hypothetical protein
MGMNMENGNAGIAVIADKGVKTTITATETKDERAASSVLPLNGNNKKDQESD